MFAVVNDLDTAVRYRLPVVIIVLNDNGFGAEVHHLQMVGMPDDVGRYENPPLAEVARALGADALRLETIDDVALVADRLANLEGPLVVDVPISQEIRPEGVEIGIRLGHQRDMTAAPA
jgi:thiamine pyrophosphate-dependent acetolactate synthase large subunit-like protein